MKHEFDSVGDAIDAGYESPGKAGRVLDSTETHDIIIVDTSGPRSYGYSFAVKAVPIDDDAIKAGHRSGLPFGRTVTIWTKDKNQVGGDRSFRAMFAPETLSEAIQEAKAAL